MIVFVRTKNETETLAEKLRARGFSARRASTATSRRRSASAPSTS